MARWLFSFIAREFSGLGRGLLPREQFLQPVRSQAPECQRFATYHLPKSGFCEGVMSDFPPSLVRVTAQRFPSRHRQMVRLMVRALGEQPGETEPTNARHELRVIGLLCDDGQADAAGDGICFRRPLRHAIELDRMRYDHRADSLFGAP